MHTANARENTGDRRSVEACVADGGDEEVMKVRAAFVKTWAATSSM